MNDIFNRAKAIIQDARNHPDPETALEALEAEAGPEDRAMFPGLWSALTLQLNMPEATEARS